MGPGGPPGSPRSKNKQMSRPMKTFVESPCSPLKNTVGWVYQSFLTERTRPTYYPVFAMPIRHFCQLFIIRCDILIISTTVVHKTFISAIPPAHADRF